MKNKINYVSFWQAFAAQVQKTPKNTALKSTVGSELSYQALYLEAQSLAYALTQSGLQPGDRVGINYPRSTDFVIAVLACWYAGLVWCPLSQLPGKRRTSIEDRIQNKITLGNDPEDTKKENLNGFTTQPPENFKAFNPPADHPAYLIFTSGSSGLPKGVLVPHAGLVDVFQAQIKALDLDANDRSLWLLSPLFDASISDLGTALLAGACLVIHPDPIKDLSAFYALLTQAEISYIDLPPALLGVLEPDKVPSGLKKMLIGGEAPPLKAVQYWSQRLRLLNVYGPTEASICTSLCRCSADWSEALLGQPLPNVTYRIIGNDGKAHQEGELWIHSPGLALEYWQDPALSQSRFVFAQGKRWYRSGDWVAKKNQEYLFLGRIDRQLKHLGRLICPEEIEAVLKQLAEVDRVAVVLHEQGNLVAFLQTAHKIETPKKLKRHILDQLPEWMCPELFVLLEIWPETANGKTDFKRLQTESLQNTTQTEDNYFKPQNHAERILNEAWKKIFCLKKLPLEPQFFRLGGNSIQVLRLVALASEQGLTLKPEAVFQYPNLSDLAKTGQQNSHNKHHTGISAQNLIDSLPDLLPARPKRKFKHPSEQKNEPLLLTGSTGFLGGHLLAELLNHSSRQIHCLVRAQSVQAGQTRIAAALRQWHSTPDWQRIKVYPADLSKDRLGLSPESYQELSKEVGAILHCAARVDLVRDYQSLFQVNTAAVKSLYALNKPLHYVSTLSVFVASEPKPTHAPEEKLCDSLNAHELSKTLIYGGYAQSKWAAEAWLEKQNHPTELPLWIYRPGLITGHSQTGQSPSQDWLGAFIAGLLKIGAIPDLPDNHLAVDITPIDYASQGILALMQEKPGIYHLANPRSLRLNDLLHYLAEWAELSTMPLTQWQIHASQCLSKLSTRSKPELFSATAALLALNAILSPQNNQDWHALNLFQATGIKLASEQTQTLLHRQGIDCPEASRELLSRYFKAYRSAYA